MLFVLVNMCRYLSFDWVRTAASFDFWSVGTLGPVRSAKYTYEPAVNISRGQIQARICALCMHALPNSLPYTNLPYGERGLSA